MNGCQASHASEKSDRTDVQIMTGAILSVRTLCNTANAKAIAPAGPAALRSSIWFHCVSSAPNVSRAPTRSGKPNSLRDETTIIVLEGARLCPDKITPRANNVRGAAAAPTNFKPVKTGAGVGICKRFIVMPSTMTIRIGLVATRLSDALTEEVLFASRSVETIKNANVIEASHAK